MDKLVFAVLSVKRNDEYDYFDIGLHAHFGLNMGGLKEPYDVGPMSDCYIDEGGDIEMNLTVSKELLKKWTGITGRDIDHGIDSIRMGSTYNLMVSLPRTITITKDKVIVLKNDSEIIDSMNVCNLIFKNQHPIDKNV